MNFLYFSELFCVDNKFWNSLLTLNGVKLRFLWSTHSFPVVSHKKNSQANREPRNQVHRQDWACVLIFLVAVGTSLYTQWSCQANRPKRAPLLEIVLVSHWDLKVANPSQTHNLHFPCVPPQQTEGVCSPTFPLIWLTDGLTLNVSNLTRNIWPNCQSSLNLSTPVYQ